MDKTYQKVDNIARMEFGGDENETGYLQDSMDCLDQSVDSLKDSFTVPVFNTGQAGSLQSSQGFSYSGIPANTSTDTLLQAFSGVQPLTITGETPQILGVQTQSSFVSPTLTFSGKPPLSSCQTSSGHYIRTHPSSDSAITNQSGGDSVNQDIKPVFLPGDFASLGLVGMGQQYPGSVTISSQNQTVLNSGAFVMSLKNNPGIVTFGQADNNPGELKSDSSVFTFVKEYDSAKLTPANTENSSELSGLAGQTGSKTARTKQPSKHRQRKNRSQSTSNENVTKTETQQGGSPNKLDTADSQNTGEIGFKPSLLDEILTEKKMALMRSPEVIHFLQTQQKKITHGQYTET